jgi:hypothetical protein
MAQHRGSLVIYDDQDWEMINQAAASMGVSRSVFFAKSAILIARFHRAGVYFQHIYDKFNVIVSICTNPKFQLFFDFAAQAEKQGVTVHHICANMDKIIDLVSSTC